MVADDGGNYEVLRVKLEPPDWAKKIEDDESRKTYNRCLANCYADHS